jgi:membrane protein YdbS with pleckstrin-like domain
VIDCLVARVRLLWAPPGGRAWQHLALLVLAIYLVFTINLVLITEYRWSAWREDVPTAVELRWRPRVIRRRHPPCWV